MKKVLYLSWLIFFLFSAFAYTQIIVEPSILEFEETVKLRTSTTELLISNNQEETQIISGIRMIGEGADRFLIEREAFVLSQGETRSIKIQFLPDTIGDFQASILIEYNSGEIEVPVSGTGIVPDPTTHNTVFENVLLNGGETVANLNPGTAFSLKYNYQTWSRTGCPGCIIYIVAGIEEDAQRIIGLGIPGTYPGVSGSIEMSLTAPVQESIFTIFGFHAPDVSSGNAIGRYENTFFSDAHIPLGLIAVSSEDAPPPPTGLRHAQNGKKITLYWDNNNIESLSKYYIYRGILPHVLILLDSVDASSFNYIDDDIREETHYYYRIRAINESKKTSGFSETSTITTSDHEIKLEETKLLNGFYSYPNPLEHETVIAFELSRSSHIRLNIFDITGKCIENLINEELHPGKYEFNWMPKRPGRGIYFCRIDSDDFSNTLKLVVLK